MRLLDLHWTESGGGPLIAIPRSGLYGWRGVKADHYASACAVGGYVGLLRVCGGDALVFGDEPFPATWLPTFPGWGYPGAFLRWVMADPSTETPVAELVALPKAKPVLSFTVPDGGLVLFDAAEPGGEILGDRLDIDLPSGDYNLATDCLSTDPDVKVLVHRVWQA